MKTKKLIQTLLIFTLATLAFTTNLSGKFINLNFPGLDIGVGSEGDVAVVGTDNQVYVYDVMNDSWVFMYTNDILSINRLDVDSDGTIYVISLCGIYYLDCENHWVKLPGKGYDIGVGVGGDVWKTGDDQYVIEKDYGPGFIQTSLQTGKTFPIPPPSEKKKYINYGVWRLICECKCRCYCRRICIRFRKRFYDPCLKRRPCICYWFRVDGYGKNIDVFPNGDAIISVDHYDKKETLKTVDFHGMYFQTYKCGDDKLDKNAGDVTVGNTGVVYVVDEDTGDVYKCHQGKEWKKVNLIPVTKYQTGYCTQSLRVERLSAGPYNHFWFIHKLVTNQGTTCNGILSNKVFTSSIFNHLKDIDIEFPIILEDSKTGGSENPGKGANPPGTENENPGKGANPPGTGEDNPGKENKKQP